MDRCGEDGLGCQLGGAAPRQTEVGPWGEGAGTHSLNPGRLTLEGGAGGLNFLLEALGAVKGSGQESSMWGRGPWEEVSRMALWQPACHAATR